MTAFIFLNDDPEKKNVNNYQSISSIQMNANNINTWYRNFGSFNRDPATGNSGFEWPKGEGHYARYASGLWLGGVVGNDTLIAVAEYDYEYLPGYIDSSGNPQGIENPAYKIYNIYKGDDTSSDYVNWPFNQGAYKNENGKPLLLGEQTMFYSYTDGYPEAHGNNAGNTAPLKAVILQTNWAYKDNIQGVYSNTIFTEYRIINKSNLTWRNFYIALWTDDDLGDASDDAGGCDTNLNLAFTYNFDNNDAQYGMNPPAVAFLILRGPLVESIGDTVKYYNPPGCNSLDINPNRKEVKMTVFNLYANADPTSGDPSNYIETYLNLQGIRRNRTPWVTPQGDTTTFAYSGDPETLTGWNETSGRNRRFIQSIGPINVNPGDTQSILTAQIIARGLNNRNSVTKLKNTAKIIKAYYDNNFHFPDKPASPVVSSYAPGNGKITLKWNDSAERISIPNNFSGGVYQFQGYNIYQVNAFSQHPSPADTVLIKTFDIIDGIKNIYDSVYIESIQGIGYGIVQKGSDNGIARFIDITHDTISNKNFINGTEYKFIVTAYYYDSAGGIYSLPKVNESVRNVIRVIPQNLNAGFISGYDFGDTILTNQKDLASIPVVFDPFKLISANYTSSFSGNANQNLGWTLTRTSNGITKTLFENIHNFDGNGDTAREADGLMFIHQRILDSGVVKDPGDSRKSHQANNTQSIMKAWTYEPAENLWFSGPDTTAVRTAKLFTYNQFQSRSCGMSAPANNTFRNTRSLIFSNGKYFTGITNSPMLTGGPLRKIEITFGENCKAYRYAPNRNVLTTDTNLTLTPYKSMTEIPFSVYAADELDSSAGTKRKLNVAFIDADSSGTWNPDTTALAKYELIYILASNYDSIPNLNYTNKNPGSGATVTGFPAMDIMYVWLPRLKSENGIIKTWTSGDKFTITPYRPTRGDFVPGFPVKYSWTTTGSYYSEESEAAGVNQIKAFPNPYYGFSELEYNDADEKFIYFSHLPSVCNIFIYTLDGVLVNTINRNQTDPNNTLEKWNLQNISGSYVASGMYIVYVDCKNLGSKTLKIAVFQN